MFPMWKASGCRQATGNGSIAVVRRGTVEPTYSKEYSYSNSKGDYFPVSASLSIEMTTMEVRCVGIGCILRSSCVLYDNTIVSNEHRVIDQCDVDTRPGYVNTANN